MFIKKPTYRKFDYQPRHYNAKEDKTEQRKRKLGFRSYKASSVSKKQPIAFIIMFLIIIYIFLKFNGYI